jgi:hypothetical protein
MGFFSVRRFFPIGISLCGPIRGTRSDGKLNLIIIIDRCFLPPSYKSYSKLVVLAKYPNLIVKIFSRVFPKQFNKETGL